MSYTFKIIAKDGKLEVAEGSVTPPDGAYLVSGHVNDEWESIGVTRYAGDPPVNQMFQATAYAKRL